MNRDEQIKLMQSARERTTGYLRAWMTDNAVKEALFRKPDPAPPHDRGKHRERRFG